MTERIRTTPKYVSMRSLVGDPEDFRSGLRAKARVSSIDSMRPIPRLLMGILIEKSPGCMKAGEIHSMLNEVAKTCDPRRDEKNLVRAEFIVGSDVVESQVREQLAKDRTEANYPVTKKMVIKSLYVRQVERPLRKPNADIVKYNTAALADVIEQFDDNTIYHIVGASKYLIAPMSDNFDLPFLLAEDEDLIQNVPQEFSSTMRQLCLLKHDPDEHKGGTRRLDYVSGLPATQVEFLKQLTSSPGCTIEPSDFDIIFPKMQKSGKYIAKHIYISRLKSMKESLAERGVEADFSFDPKKGVKLLSLNY